MTLQIDVHKAASRDHLGLLAARPIQSGFDQLSPNAAPLELRRHARVSEHDRTGAAMVFKHGPLSVKINFKRISFRVMLYCE
jgi:hypothetical protein